MSFWTKLFGQEQKQTDSGFVESCFSFDVGHESDDSKWQEIDALKEVPGLVNSNRISEAESILRASLATFPDYGFVHAWQAMICERRGQIREARHAYEVGIKLSKKKQTLCGQLALLELNHGTLREAVRWWIRSVLLQLNFRRVGDAVSFLYLSSVAAALGIEEGLKLLLTSMHGQQGSIGLTTSEQEKVSQKVRAEGSSDVCRQFRLRLCREAASGRGC